MVTMDLKQFKRQVEAQTRRDITWAEIREATGLAQSTINRLMNNKNERVDLSAIDRMCKFFGLPAGPVPFIIYLPEDNSGEA